MRNMAQALRTHRLPVMACSRLAIQRRRAHVAGFVPRTSIPTLLTTQNVTLPDIPELYNPNFLDILIAKSESPVQNNVSSPIQDSESPTARNALLDALRTTSHQTLTDNGAPAYSSTLSPTLDAFNGLTKYQFGPEVGRLLDNAWKEDANLTLRMIWNLRSIHDGKSDKETFYRAFGWLYEHHPRTAIANLPLLVEPVCTTSKPERSYSHGYWKDLLNILALATVDELANIPHAPHFLHPPKMQPLPRRNERRHPKTVMNGIEDHNTEARSVARAKREAKHLEFHTRLVDKLSQPKYRALFIAVARLFSERLVKDMKILGEIGRVDTPEARLPLLRQISLAGKWAPSPGESHDRVTNIATAISLLLHVSSPTIPATYPSALSFPLETFEQTHILRSYYQRWVLTELRRATVVAESLMSARRWTQIPYQRVPSICMKRNNEHFAKHDPEGFEKYLIAVESGKKTISGATLLPHELVGQIVSLSQKAVYLEGSKARYPSLTQIRKKIAETKLRVVEAQWKTLIERLRESGTIENSLAICDVSGSMGSVSCYSKNEVWPIFPAISLSLVLATLAKPPFDSCFITFSARPQFVQLDLTKPLYETVQTINASEWGVNTDLNAVFCKLILPLAVKNKIRPEDMIKRLFIFSDMQFDEVKPEGVYPGGWETNYDAIERAYREHGYEVPQIVYWDLASRVPHTVEVQGDRKGVAMMNGFSPAMLKVFMGEEADEVSSLANPDSLGAKDLRKEFTPITVMQRALLKSSFDGLVIHD